MELPVLIISEENPKLSFSEILIWVVKAHEQLSGTYTKFWKWIGFAIIRPPWYLLMKSWWRRGTRWEGSSFQMVPLQFPRHSGDSGIFGLLLLLGHVQRISYYCRWDSGGRSCIVLGGIGIDHNLVSDRGQENNVSFWGAQMLGSVAIGYVQRFITENTQFIIVLN